MILLIDNFDSFTYNIYQYLLTLGEEVEIKRNDEITADEVREINPTHIIISPGPGSPETAGISVELVKRFKGRIPILGICLGHQCIAAAFGGNIVKSKKIHHGKTSKIIHDGRTVFRNLSNPFTATRYHSLMVEAETLSPELEVTAKTPGGEIMGIRHREYTVEGVQFHPESIASQEGMNLLKNFISGLGKPEIIGAAIRKCHARTNLTFEEAAELMEIFSSGEASDAQVAAVLTALSIKGETVDELSGFTSVMRSKALKLKSLEGASVVDTCGTGGDGSGTFNISSVAALVTAGAGVNVAKHGNRSVTSRCGSADLFEALGINIQMDTELVERAIDEVGIGFLFAPRFHSSMKHVVTPRREIAIRTLFNLIGPLTNPSGARRQVVGVYDSGATTKVASVLARLGAERAMVVHGEDGLDEITLTGLTEIAEVRDGWVRTWTFDPRDYGFSYCSPEELKGENLKVNTEIALSILNGDKGPKRDIVLLNSAAAIVVAGQADDFSAAVELAADSIDSGRALAKMEALSRFGV